MKAVAVVQARLDSTRLPGKVLESIGDSTVLDYILTRLVRCTTLESIVLATTQLPSDDPLVARARWHGVTVFRGDVDNVLARVYSAGVESSADYVVRITADCPLIDPATCDRLVAKAQEESLDFVANYVPPTFPDGLDVSVVHLSLLERTVHDAVSKYDREHVTTYIERELLSQISWSNVYSRTDQSHRRWTVDTIEDLTFLRQLNDEVGQQLAHMSYEEILEALDNCKELTDAGSIYRRNYGHNK